MWDWLTVLELTAAAVVVIGVLSVISHFVNQARAKASGTNSSKTPTVTQPSPVVTPEPRNAASAAMATSPAAVIPPADVFIPPATVVTPPRAEAAPSSEALLPPLEPIPLVSEAPLPAVEPNPPASKIVSVRFPRFAKPRAVPTARLKNAVRLKTTRSSKIKRIARSGNTGGRRISFAPLTKAKPALTRRPKPAMQIRRKKITAPVKRSGKPTARRSPRPVLAPA
jgi:hypothetical protein